MVIRQKQKQSFSDTAAVCMVMISSLKTADAVVFSKTLEY